MPVALACKAAISYNAACITVWANSFNRLSQLVNLQRGDKLQLDWQLAAKSMQQFLHDYVLKNQRVYMV